MRAARSSASPPPPGQRGLFNEAEAAVEVLEAVGFDAPLETTPLREDKAPAKPPGRTALPAHLPRIEARHELPVPERVCGYGTSAYEETSEQPDYIPAKVQVIRHVRPKYACGPLSRRVKIAPVPGQILPRSNVSSRLLAHLITSNFVDGLPFYRTQTVLARHDIALPRGTQAGAVIHAHVPVIPLMNLMNERLRASDYIRIDETSVHQVREGQCCVVQPGRNCQGEWA